MKQLFNNFRAVMSLLSVFLLLAFAPLAAQTNFVKHAGNPVLPRGNPGEWDGGDAAFADVLFDGSTYHMWYSGAYSAGSLQRRIGHATSPDGISWTLNTLNNPVLDLGNPGEFDNYSVQGPEVIFDGSQYHMWYTGDDGSTYSIGYATAPNPDGPWTKHPGPVLVGDPGTWDQNSVGGAIVIRMDTLYQMWYSGISTGLWQTGYATSTDGINWSKYSGNPVLPVGAAGEWDRGWAAASDVLFDAGQYQMWYDGDDGDIQDVRIGYATSPDGIHWTKDTLNNPIMSGDPGTWDADNVWFPRVIKDADAYHMWYSGRDVGVDRIGYAVDPISGIETFDNVRPEDFYLKQNYPNPFNPATNIEFSIPKTDFVTLKVFNILGQEVATLVSERLTAGTYKYDWDASSLASGIYLYRIQSGVYFDIKKMILVR